MNTLLITIAIVIWVAVLAILWAFLLDAIEQTANYWYENAPKIIWLIAFTGTLVLPFVYFAEKRII
ncbi:hypothetical protein CA950_19185 [Acinetobacter pittii]|uniref:hypothetical protein n=1 Tax=Acinetobacter pittii TaxID=48296 RepID=UPI000C18DF9B|nr:hypothetical protein CA950_19185 [Acinetobacter pittii]